MSNDEGKFLRGALERVRNDGTPEIAVAAMLGFVAPGQAKAAPVMHIVFTPDEKEAYVRYLRRVGFQNTLVDITPSTDGLNHYNIYSQARTEIGRMASNFYSRRGEYFVTPHGPFSTLEGYYHYLRIVDYAMVDVSERTRVAEFDAMRRITAEYLAIEQLRAVDGTECIRLGRQLKSEIYGGTSYRPGAFTEEAEKCFIAALVGKLHVLTSDGVSLGNVFAEIAQANVPLKHYYTYQGRKMFPPHWDWLPSLILKVAAYIDPEGSSFDYLEVLNKLGIKNGII
ncbi:hypothetical protein MLDJOKPK_00216 [Salmonella phage SPAsTU]|nr:hypothetical protein STsAS_194 [Salmonella phage STsAS]AWN09126.1 hypothetical protein MLDJOKPK_00216 [Salmonella phage SPAsTU]